MTSTATAPPPSASPAPSRTDRPAGRRGRRAVPVGVALVAASLPMFMATLDNLVMTTALPVLQVELSASLEQLQWMVNAYTLSFAVLQGLWGSASIDADTPTVSLTTQTLFDKYYLMLQPQQRFMDEETAKGGFRSLMFNGKPVIVDSKCPDSYWVMLNEEYLHWMPHKDENFRFEPFAKPVNQNLKIAHIYWMGVFASSNNRMHAYASALTA